jgi:MSHA biogenesis protein MshJ
LPAAAAASATGPTLYRHGVELSVEGSYADLLSYLQALEALPQQLLWGNLELKVEQYPRVVLTLRLYTLSLASAWVEL